MELNVLSSNVNTMVMKTTVVVITRTRGFHVAEGIENGHGLLFDDSPLLYYTGF